MGFPTAITSLNNCSNYSKDAFSAPWRCYGQVYGEEVQLLAKSYYEAANTILEALFGKIYSTALFGEENTEYYDRVMDIHYLFFYMLRIYFKRQEDEKLDTAAFALNEYYTTYDIECIRKRFKCKGIEIYPLLEVFHIQTLDTPFYVFGGIGIDVITDHGLTQQDHIQTVY